MIELPIIDTINREELNKEVVPPDLSIRTYSEILRDYAQLGSLKTWAIGQQEATINNEIISRTYSELTFEENGHDFDFNDALIEVDEYGGRYYWRVLHRFTENEYYSDNSESAKNFKIWENGSNRWQQEIIYTHTEREVIRWDRPSNIVSLIEIPPPAGSPMGTPSTFTCPTSGSGGSETETGTSNWFTIEIGSETKCKQWESISIPFKITVDVGGALGAVITSDSSIDRVILKENSEDTEGEEVGLGSYGDPIRLKERYLDIEIEEPTTTTPTYIEVTLYGEEFYRYIVPLDREEEPELLEHSSEVLQEQRYKPPGRSDFPDNFWNNTELTEIGGFNGRQGQVGGII